mgnify:CR=1 FL=1
MAPIFPSMTVSIRTTLCMFLLTVSATAGPPALLDSLVIDYPEMALAAQLEGEAAIVGTINEYGRMTDWTVQRSTHPILTYALVRAVRFKVFQPAIDDQGAPCTGDILLSHTFDLQAEITRLRSNHRYISDWPHPRLSDVLAPLPADNSMSRRSPAFLYRGVTVCGDVSIDIVDDLIRQARDHAAAHDSMTVIVITNAFPFDFSTNRGSAPGAFIESVPVRTPENRHPVMKRFDFELDEEGNYRFFSVTNQLRKFTKDPP